MLQHYLCSQLGLFGPAVSYQTSYILLKITNINNLPDAINHILVRVSTLAQLKTRQ